MDQAKHYLIRYQRAETLAERQTFAAEYRTFLETLTETERNQARTVMSVLWPSINQRVDALEPMMRSLETLLQHLETKAAAEAKVKA